MPRYAALLRGVSPINARMPELKDAFEFAGFSDVRTVIASGNVVFTARRASEASLQRKSEAAMRERLGREFLTIVRPIESLRELLNASPFEPFRVRSGEKQIVTFLRDPPTSKLTFPVALYGARILAMTDREVFTAYVPDPKGALFMSLIEKTFGPAITTRSWDTVVKIVRAGER